MKKIVKTIADTIAFFRPLLLIPIWTPAIMGFWNGGGKKGITGEWELMLMVTYLGVGIYGLNQIFDVEGDRLNKKNLPLALGFISKNLAKTITYCAFVGALIMAIETNINTLILIFAGMLLGIAYSVPPLRLKDRAIPALISNGLGHGMLIYILGYSYAFSQQTQSEWSWFALFKAFAYGIAFSAVYLFTTIPDIEGDKKTDKHTMPILIGERKTMALGIVGVFIAGAAGLIFREPALFLTAVISIPFYWSAVAAPEIEPRLILRANKVAVITLALLSCFYVQKFIILIILTVAFSAIYNRVRLNVKYP